MSRVGWMEVVVEYGFFKNLSRNNKKKLCHSPLVRGRALKRGNKILSSISLIFKKVKKYLAENPIAFKTYVVKELAIRETFTE